MALTKQKVQDKIEIVSAFKHIQIRYANQIVEDGTVLSSAFERTVVSCGDWDKADEHNVRAIADAVWNADLIAAYEAHVAQTEAEWEAEAQAEAQAEAEALAQAEEEAPAEVVEEEVPAEEPSEEA